jgi:two-component system, LytTR family, sensor kinase
MLKLYRTKRQFYYLLFAIAFGFVWYLFKLGGMPKPLRALFSTGIDLFFSLIALIITVEVLLLRLFYKRHYRLFAFFFILVIAITGSLTIMSQLRLMGYSLSGYYERNLIQFREHYYYWFWSDLVLGSYFMISFIALGGFAIRLSFDRILTARHLETLDKERSLAELEMLKNQINPHFLFNALNTIYYKIDRINAPARLMVERFSSLLRYQLYECSEPGVKIEKELKFIADYIELQKERLSQNMEIIYDDLKNIEGVFIAPFILMQLIENCFKHASQNLDKENRIVIKCKLENGWFYFDTINTIKQTGDVNNPGIGLANVRRRLDLIYPDKHLLTIESTNEIFNLVLKVRVT